MHVMVSSSLLMHQLTTNSYCRLKVSMQYISSWSHFYICSKYSMIKPIGVIKVTGTANVLHLHIQHTNILYLSMSDTNNTKVILFLNRISSRVCG